MDIKSAPWFPTAYEKADAKAIQQLADGTASPEQQQRALKWIINNACGTYDLTYHPTGDRDTCFAEGRRFVGLQIVKMLKISLSKLASGPTEQP